MTTKTRHLMLLPTGEWVKLSAKTQKQLQSPETHVPGFENKAIRQVLAILEIDNDVLQNIVHIEGVYLPFTPDGHFDQKAFDDRMYARISSIFSQTNPPDLTSRSPGDPVIQAGHRFTHRGVQWTPTEVECDQLNDILRGKTSVAWWHIPGTSIGVES
jgi:hypothetical protein